MVLKFEFRAYDFEFIPMHEYNRRMSGGFFFILAAVRRRLLAELLLTLQDETIFGR